MRAFFFLQRSFDQQCLSLTFSNAIFLGNGLIAIVSGLFANLLADTLSFGPVAPFDAAACFLAIGMAIILSSWTENYGDSSESKDLFTQFRGAAVAIASGEYVILFYHSLFTVSNIVEAFNILNILFDMDNLLQSDEKIALLGAIQSLFEGSMYTFVFL